MWIEAFPEVWFCLSCGADKPAEFPAASSVCDGPNCDSQVLVRSDLALVCDTCGRVKSSGNYALPFDSTVLQEFYKRSFYINELLSQWQLQEPPIPAPLLELLRTAHKRHGGELSKETVHVLCRSVSAKRPPDIKRKRWVRLPRRLGRAFKAQRTGAPLTNLRKFGEKWRSIMWRLGGPKPPRAPQHLLESLRAFASRVDIAFEEVRHEPGCPRTKDCHKKYGCRHNIINTSYLLKKGLLNFYGNRDSPHYKAHAAWFPQPNKAYRQRIRERYWLPICKQLKLKHWPV